MDLYDRLEAERSSDPLTGVARVALQRRRPRQECAKYLDALKRTMWEDPPPFVTPLYAEMYRAASADGQWLAIWLITNVQRSSDHAKRLWSFAANAVSAEERRHLKGQAIGASRYALVYLELLDLWFPKALDHALRSELARLAPRYSRRQKPAASDACTPSISDFVQLNAAAIRAVAHQLMLRSAVGVPREAHIGKRAATITHNMLRDLLRDVADTAVLIEHRTERVEPGELRTMFRKGIRDFHRFTTEEPLEFSYHLRFGNYP